MSTQEPPIKLYHVKIGSEPPVKIENGKKDRSHLNKNVIKNKKYINTKSNWL